MDKLKVLQAAQDIINSLEFTEEDICDEENLGYVKNYISDIDDYIEGIKYYIEGW